MPQRLVPILTAALVAGAAGSLLGQTATVTAERLVTIPDDEAVLLVRVQAPLTLSTADIVEAIAPARVRADELAGRAASRDFGPLASASQEFLFRLVRPLGRYAETQQALRGLSASPRSGLLLWVEASTQAGESTVERARAGALPVLFSEAKGRAEAMLAGAGFRPGAIVELAETITRQAGGVRLALSVQMARVGAEPGAGIAVSTIVTPAAAPYRLAPPRLTVSYRTGAGGRARLFELLAPAELNEADLTSVTAEPDTFSQDRNREPGPVTFTYGFSATVSDADALARLQRLPSLNDSGGSAEVVFPVSPAPADPVALLQAARARADRLAGLLGGALGESLGSAPGSGLLSIPTIGLRVGDFSVAIPGIRIFPLFNSTPDPPSPAPLRYRFAVAANATQ